MEESVGVLKFAECRAKEILSVMKDVSRKEPKLLAQKLPHQMRRRAASHNPKRLPRSIRDLISKQDKSKHKKRKHHHQNRLKAYTQRQLNSSWLPTHIWFAKRFHMKLMYGYKLPIHSTGKNFRVCVKAATRGTLLQDMTYYCCIELKGCEEKILSKLALLTDNSIGTNFTSELFIHGAKEGRCFLYHPNSFPFQAIGLVYFLWKPYFNDTYMDNEESHIQSSNSVLRQLWLWCHPCIYLEVLEVLVSIFQLEELKEKKLEDNCSNSSKDTVSTRNLEDKFASKVNYSKTKLYFKKEKNFSGSDVTLTLLKDTLVRHRLIGPQALSVISNVLKHADVSFNELLCTTKESNNVSSEDNLRSAIENVSATENQKNVFWWQKYYRNEKAKSVHEAKSKLLDYLEDSNYSYMLPFSAVIGLTIKDPRIYWRRKKSESNYSSQSNYQQGISNFEDFTSLHAFSALWSKEVRDESTETQLSENEINIERSKYISAKEGLDLGVRENKVPIIIIHQPGFNGIGGGWDLIAPQGWGMAFWIPFMYSGSLAGGLRDVCNINLESGVPNFPDSFPDTSAGKVYEEEDREENIKTHLRHPPNKRPNFETLGSVSPYKMPWITLLNNWKEQLKNVEWVQLPSISSFFKSIPNDEYDNNLFVLRSKRPLMDLKKLCNKTRYFISSNTEVEKTTEYFESAVHNFITMLSASEIKYFTRALILVRIKCLNRGIPKKFSCLYLPNDLDIKVLKESPKLLSPVEPNHGLPPKKKIKLSKQEKKQNLDKVLSAWKNPEDLFSDCERKVIGYASEGAFSYVTGFGCGIGHCALTAFLTLMESCYKFEVLPIVLFKEQNSFQYRVANIELIDFY